MKKNITKLSLTVLLFFVFIFILSQGDIAQAKSYEVKVGNRILADDSANATYKISNKKIASVDENGYVTGKKEGKRKTERK